MNKKISFLLLLIIVGVPVLTYTIVQTQYSSSKYIEIDKKVDIPYLKHNKKITLLFFGYVGCEEVCTPFLNELKESYNSESWIELKKDTEIVFVNLTPAVDYELPMMYAKSFDDSFIGIHLNKEELYKIDNEFKLSFSKSIFQDGKINHSDYLYVIKDDVLKRIYVTKPLNTEQLHNYLVLIAKSL